MVVGSSLSQGSSSQCFYFKHYLIWMYTTCIYRIAANFRGAKFLRFSRKLICHTMQLYEAEMADVMHKEHEKATELEKVKEEEKWQQSIQYQEQLERQLEEQVCVGGRGRG